MIITLFFYISKTLGNIPFLQGKYFPFVASGLAFQYLFSGIINASPAKTLEWRDIGVLESLIHSPTSSWRIYLTAGSYDIIFSFVKALLIVSGILYFTKASVDFLWMTSSLFLITGLALNLSIISTCSFLLWKKVSLIEMGGSLSSLFLAGVYFPVDILPKAFQWMAFINPAYHSLLLFRKSLRIHSPDMELMSAQSSFLILSAWLFITFLFSILFYKYSEKKILSKGSLSHH